MDNPGLTQLLLKSEPFHILFGENMVVTAVGQSLLELGGPEQIGMPFELLVHSVRPLIDFSFKTLSKHTSSVLLLTHRSTGIPLRGQVLIDAENGVGIFVGIPWFAHVEEYSNKGVRLDMLPIQYGLVETLFLLQTNQASLDDFRRLTKQLSAQQVDLKIARQELQNAYEARTRFFAMMSHEIRTPMSGIMGMIEILRSLESSPRQTTCLQSLDNCVNSLMVILDDLLDFSKLDADKLQLNQEPFDIREFVLSTASLMRASAEAKGLELKVDLFDIPETWVLGDRHRIRQVVLNLLSNAIKFTGSGSVSLQVHPTDQQDRWAISVKDTGAGLSEESVEKLFQPFEQTGGGIASQFGGTGLGLFICRKLVELMGGDILAESILGLGTSFRCEIPLPAAVPPSREISASYGAPEIRPGLQILVVEDNDVNAMVIEHLLEMMEASFVRAVNGKEGLVAALSRPFDLILMDCQMPVMGGVEATSLIRNLEGPCQRVPIVALTANAFAEDEIACRRAGMDGFVPKPINAARLAEAIRIHTGNVLGQQASPD